MAAGKKTDNRFDGTYRLITQGKKKQTSHNQRDGDEMDKHRKCQNRRWSLWERAQCRN